MFGVGTAWPDGCSQERSTSSVQFLHSIGRCGSHIDLSEVGLFAMCGQNMSRKTNQAFKTTTPPEKQISHKAPAWLLHFQTFRTAKVASRAETRFTMVMGCIHLSSLISKNNVSTSFV